MRTRPGVWAAALSLGLSGATLACQPRERSAPDRGARPLAELVPAPELAPLALGRGRDEARSGDARELEAPDWSWRDADSCELALPGPTDGRDGAARIASWRLRAFPDGDPDAGPGSDTAWLSCALSRLDAPVVAVQGFRRHAQARRESKRLLELLNRRTGGAWRLELDRCPTSDRTTHAGFLYDSARVQASGFSNVNDLASRGGCRGENKLGFAGYFRFGGGLDLRLISVHMPSGAGTRAYELRQRARSGLRQSAAPSSGDRDLLVLGDFATQGCSECDTLVTPPEEANLAAAELSRAWPRLHWLENDLDCTGYGDGDPLPLDHVARSALSELPKNARVHVAGSCRLLRCERAEGRFEELHARLSDRCPIVVEVTDRDWDDDG